MSSTQRILTDDSIEALPLEMYKYDLTSFVDISGSSLLVQEEANLFSKISEERSPLLSLLFLSSLIYLLIIILLN